MKMQNNILKLKLILKIGTEMELLLFRVLVQFQPQIPISEFARPAAKIVKRFLCWEKYDVYRPLNLWNACRAEHRERDLIWNATFPPRYTVMECDRLSSLYALHWLLLTGIMKYEISRNPLTRLALCWLSVLTAVIMYSTDPVQSDRQERIL